MNNGMYPWISASGAGNDAPLEDFRGKKAYVLAYFTDAFRAGWADRMLAEAESNMDKLLELRVFNDSRELWLHRSRLGAPFVWRLAAEEGIKPEEKEKYCFETRQLLDLGEGPDAEPTFDESDGLRVLKTEAGRSFKLPIAKDERYVRILNYVAYDENGVANAADWRLMGFAKEGK